MSQAKTSKGAAAVKETAAGTLALEFKGETFTIPAALPFKVLKAIRDEDFVGVVEILLGEDIDRFWALDPSLPDVVDEFLPAALAEYGLEPGESAASPTS